MGHCASVSLKVCVATRGCEVLVEIASYRSLWVFVLVLRCTKSVLRMGLRRCGPLKAFTLLRT